MLVVNGIYKTYDKKPLLRGVDFIVNSGETICLLGPSGSGKSTLLRIIAGLEEAEAGSISWNGSNLDQVPAYQRGFGLMFQDYALFPHRSVAENVAFGLRMQKVSRHEIEKRVLDALRQVHMAEFSERRVTELSGGEQQRVALARALTPRPRLLMLDEPLGALDRNLRANLTEELRHILSGSGIPVIYVSHDQEEAFAIADRIILLHEGRVEQIGTPEEVYRNPASIWVARFLGLENLIPATVIQPDDGLVETEFGEFHLSCRLPAAESKVTILIMPDGIASSNALGSGNAIEGTVGEVYFRGEGYRIEVLSKGKIFQFLTKDSFTKGQNVHFVLHAEKLRIFPDEGHG